MNSSFICIKKRTYSLNNRKYHQISKKASEETERRIQVLTNDQLY